VGREISRNAVRAGYHVTSLSRRGMNPLPDDADLQKVEWISGNALDQAVVDAAVEKSDAVVHAIGLLFDAESGIAQLNNIVSGSKAAVDPVQSTYDKITRQTSFNLLEAIRKKGSSERTPFVFVSCAEAGWTGASGWTEGVTFGERVDGLAPEWLKRYLAAKRTVESELRTSDFVRPVILRPSLIWSWDKVDVLPAIPIFNFASMVGVPFVDKTVRVETLSKAAVAALLDSDVTGVQRFDKMEALAERSLEVRT
jgi:nucleoside-diphosphate-sugar epimerase